MKKSTQLKKRPVVEPGHAPYKPAEAAAILGTCDSQIGRLVESGELRALNVAGRSATRLCLRIPAESLADFIKRRETLPAPVPVGMRSTASQTSFPKR